LHRSSAWWQGADLPSAAGTILDAGAHRTPRLAPEEAGTIGGRVAFYMAPIDTAVGLLKEGRLTALGISTRARADILPDVVPLAEQGLSAYDVSLWFGMWAPAGTPSAVVAKINAQVARSLQDPDVVAQFGPLGISPLAMTPEEFARFVRSEIETYRRIVKQAGIPQL
jgi:tripartite-type tricarboxylate transporter receptor subunit TctC